MFQRSRQQIIFFQKNLNQTEKQWYARDEEVPESLFSVEFNNHGFQGDDLNGDERDDQRQLRTAALLTHRLRLRTECDRGPLPADRRRDAEGSQLSENAGDE